MTYTIMHNLGLDNKKCKSIHDVYQIVEKFDDLVIVDYDKMVEMENPE